MMKINFVLISDDSLSVYYVDRLSNIDCFDEIKFN